MPSQNHLHRTLAALALALPLSALVAPAHAQVVIQGTVTYGQQPQQQPTYVQQQAPQAYQQGNYVQPADPNTAYGSAYVAQPVGQPQPVRYIHRSSLIPGLLVPGIVLLAGGYLSQVIGAPLLAGELTSNQLGYAYIPLLGPWLQLGDFREIDGAAHFSWITGVAQAVGLVFLVLGLTIHDEWDEPVYALTDDPMGPTLAFDGSRATLTF